MTEKLLTPLNHQLFIVSYLGATDHKPTRFKITDTRFKVSEVFSYNDSFQTCDHHARDILESRGFNLAGYANDSARGYFFTRDFRELNEPAPAPEPTTPAPDGFIAQAVHFDAFFHGVDKNGNSLLKIKPHATQYRAFSAQRLSIAPKLRQGTKGEQIRDPHALLSILAYYANNGTDTHKQALKIPIFDYHTESNYGEQWEMVSIDETLTAARATLADYRANEPQRAHRITKRRIGA
jgi:hypothetical protein